MRAKISPFTYVGLVISLFGFIGLRFVFRAFAPSASIAAGCCKELAVWALAASLIVLIRYGEKLPLSSIRLGVGALAQIASLRMHFGRAMRRHGLDRD